MTWLAFCSWFLIALIALGVVSVIALVVIVIAAGIERRRFEKSIRLNRKDFMAEIMMANQKRSQWGQMCVECGEDGNLYLDDGKGPYCPDCFREIEEAFL